MDVEKRYKLANILLLTSVECLVWHLGAASACHIAAYITCLASRLVKRTLSTSSIHSELKGILRPRFYFPHFSISSFPFPHFCFQFPFPHFRFQFPFPHLCFFISISFVPGCVTAQHRSHFTASKGPCRLHNLHMYSPKKYIYTNRKTTSI